MALVGKVVSVLAAVMVAVLFAAAFDIGGLGLPDMLSTYALIPIVAFLIFAIASIFINPSSTALGEIDEEAIGAKIDEVRSKANSRITALQASVESLSGQDSESLIEENRLLKEQLETIQQAERDKVLKDSEDLRLRNEELEEQIKQWAIHTVGDALTTNDGATKEAA